MKITYLMQHPMADLNYEHAVTATLRHQLEETLGTLNGFFCNFAHQQINIEANLWLCHPQLHFQ